MFGQIWATGRKVGGHFGQKCPNFEKIAWTKMGGFGKFWDQTFMGIIRGPYMGSQEFLQITAAADTKDPPSPATCDSDITLDKDGSVQLNLQVSIIPFFALSSAEVFHVSPNIQFSMDIAFEALENTISNIKGSDIGDIGVFIRRRLHQTFVCR
jgi:hypothetical protein